MQPEERQIVRRQDQRFRRHRFPQLAQGRQIAGEGIAVRLVRLHADIGRYLRQNLVARDQHAGLGAIEAGELGRMTLADNDLPLSVRRSRWPCRRSAADSSPAHRDAAPIALLPLAKQLARRRVEPGAMSESAAQRREIVVAAAHHAGVKPFLFGDPQRAPASARSASRPADMVRVVMGHDDPRDRQSAELPAKICSHKPLFRASHSRYRRPSSPGRLRAATN